MANTREQRRDESCGAQAGVPGQLNSSVCISALRIALAFWSTLTNRAGGTMAVTHDVEYQYRIISKMVTSMIVGQLLFGAVSWFVNRTSSEAPATIRPVHLSDPLILAWIMVVAGSVFGALYFRNQVASSRGSLTHAELHSKTIIMWGLLEVS